MNVPTLSPKWKKTLATARYILLRTVYALCSVLLVVLFTGIFCLGAFGIYVRTYLLPEAKVDPGSIDMNYSTVIRYTDENGHKQELTRLYGSENRIWVNYEEISKYLRDAFIAIEDERFESHKGVDWKRTIGAAVSLFMPSAPNFGGSTLTQQLIKNLTGDSDVTIQRKVLEILRALELERNYSKEQIIEMYLNTINLSQGCYGVSSAAYVYFDKAVKDLTLAECACIAAITNSPTYYDPFQNPINNKERQELILGKMRKLGKISQVEYEEAMAEELKFASGENHSDTGDVYSYFVDQLIRELVTELKAMGYSETMAYKMIYAGGLTVDATIDPKVQAAIEQVYTDRNNFPAMKGTTQPESAMAIFSPEGELLGVVGGIGTKYGNLTLNRASSKRQPGSSIKPLSVYAPALEYGLITPYSVRDDSPSKLISASGSLVEASSAILLPELSLNPWPANQSRTYRGLTTVDYAVAHSLNTIPVRLLDELTLESAFSFATENMGLDLLRNENIGGTYYNDLTYAALALGGTSRGVSLLEMTAAYVPFVGSGIYRDVTTYTTVTDSEGNVLIDHSDDNHLAVSEQTAYYMRSMLESAVTSGTATAANLTGFSVAGKTGTTSSDYDRWFIGFTPYYVGGVWFGFDQNKEIAGLSYNPSVRIWKQVMEILHEDKADAVFEEPQGLQTYSYCMDSGGIPTAACYNDERGSRVAYARVFPEDAPLDRCSLHAEVGLCRETGSLAGPTCPEVDQVVKLNMYRYFAVPNVAIADERYTVHLDGVLSDYILKYYYPAISTTAEKAVEGRCYRHKVDIPY